MQVDLAAQVSDVGWIDSHLPFLQVLSESVANASAFYGDLQTRETQGFSIASMGEAWMNTEKGENQT